MNREAPSGRAVVVRPTAFGVTTTAVAIAVFAARSSINDPALAGLVWTVFVGLVIVGAAWPLAVMRFVRLDVVDAPTDAIAGRPITLGVRLRSPGLVDTVAMRVEGSDAWWSLPSGPADVEVALPRALVRSLRVTTSTDGPLGMLTVTRRFEVDLPAPLAVGPDPIPQPWNPLATPEAGSDDRAEVGGHGGDQVRSVRPYRSGDPAHLVHWPSSARIGSLVVRELEPPTRSGVVLVVDLGPGREPDGPDGSDGDSESERAVAEAAGLATAVVRLGGWLLLCTSEAGRPVAAEATTVRQIQRRLAAATPGPVGRPGPLAGGPVATVVYGPGGR